LWGNREKGGENVGGVSHSSSRGKGKKRSRGGKNGGNLREKKTRGGEKGKM